MALSPVPTGTEFRSAGRKVTNPQADNVREASATLGVEYLLPADLADVKGVDKTRGYINRAADALGLKAKTRIAVSPTAGIAFAVVAKDAATA